MKKKDTSALEDALSRYPDGTQDDAEKAWLEDLQAQDAGIQQRMEDLDTVHQALQAQGVAHPSPHFTQRVMVALKPLPQTSPAPARVWRSAALLVGVLAVTAIIIIWLSSDMFTGVTVQQVAVPYADRWNWSFAVKEKWLLYPLIAINMVLGWVLLDRAILKPLFQHRRLHQA